MHEIKDTGKKQHIMLVDDDSDDRDLFAEAIAFVDPTVQITMMRDGEQLMEHLDKQVAFPDLIFLDLNMPRKNGKECLAELKREKTLRNIPVIIYTTSLNPLDVEETFNNGAYRFFRKPNSFEELKEQLHQIIFSEISLASPRKREDFVLTPSNIVSR